MKPRRIKVFGERNTGTRAAMDMLRALPHVSLAHPGRPAISPEAARTKAIIEQKLQGRLRNEYLDAIKEERATKDGGFWAWKHSAPKFDDSFLSCEASVLFLVRDPYSWVTSLHRHPYHLRGRRSAQFQEFLEHPWLTMRRDNINAVVDSPVCLWTKKTAAYIRFIESAPVPTSVIIFEDFVADPVAALGRALADVDISANGLVALDRSTKDQTESIEDIKTRYRNQIWKKQLTRQAVEVINQHIDWDIAGYFGYSMLDPSDFPDSKPDETPENSGVLPDVPILKG